MLGRAWVSEILLVATQTGRNVWLDLTVGAAFRRPVVLLVKGRLPLSLMRVLAKGALGDSPFVSLVVAALVIGAAFVPYPTHKPIRQLNIHFFTRADVPALEGFLPAVCRCVQLSLKLVNALWAPVVFTAVLIDKQVEFTAFFNWKTALLAARHLEVSTAKLWSSRVSSTLNEALRVVTYNRLQLILRTHVLLLEWVGLTRFYLHALAHFGILVGLTSLLLLNRTAGHLVLTKSMLHWVGLVDVEGKIFLQFLNFAFAHLNLLEVLLSLLLQGAVWLHEVIIKLDQLLHLLQCISGHLSLILNVTFGWLALSVLVASNESLVLSS